MYSAACMGLTCLFRHEKQEGKGKKFGSILYARIDITQFILVWFKFECITRTKIFFNIHTCIYMMRPLLNRCH